MRRAWGGVLFVPALVLFAHLTQLARRAGGALSPVGVVLGVAAADAVSERVLELSFATV